MRVAALLMACSLSTCQIQPAMAQQVHVIAGDPGGVISTYVGKFNEWAVRGDRVIIDGLCASACTLVVSTVFNLDVCVTPRAVLGYHKPYTIDGDNNVVYGKQYSYRSNWNWYETFVHTAPQGLGQLLAYSNVPGVYEGADPSDLLAIEYDVLRRFIKPC